jgi:predicted ATPase
MMAERSATLRFMTRMLGLGQTARAQQSRGWELRCTLSLARLWQRQGRRDEARDSLAAVYGTYTEGFATPDLVDAVELLQSLER